MIKRILLALVVMLAGTNAFAANHYIRAGATGASNGTDWTNAWTSFSQVSWTRGDIYYVASGSYGSATFSQGASGSNVIEIRAAVGGSGDHGTDTGWSDSFEGQALFSAINFNTSYWTLNGQKRGSDWTSGYLIKVNHTGTGGQAIHLGSGSAVTNVTIDYVEAQGSNVHQDGASDEGIECTPGPCNDTTIAHSWVHNVGCDNLSFNQNVGQNLTVEYSWISYNNFGPTTAAHCQGIQTTFSSMILRYNVWQDIQSSGVITDAAGGNAPITFWDIYGNIFFWDAAWNAQWSGDGRVGEDNGIVGIYSLSGTNGTLRLYNNTIDGLALGSRNNCTSQATYINSGMHLTAIVENNIWSNIGSGCATGGGNAGGTVDYNGYYKVSGGKGDNGSHSFTSNINPYVNEPAGTIAGFMLTADTPAGVQLASPYNMDMLGTPRGSNGLWDIGALQISGTTSSLPPVPQGLHVVSIQ
jgi:hypothetical protein